MSLISVSAHITLCAMVLTMRRISVSAYIALCAVVYTMRLISVSAHSTLWTSQTSKHNTLIQCCLNTGSLFMTLPKCSCSVCRSFYCCRRFFTSTTLEVAIWLTLEALNVFMQTMGTKGYVIIINVLVNAFRLVWIPMLWVYILILAMRRSTLGVRIWRLSRSPRCKS